MKNPDRKTVSRLEKLPNIGPAIAADLRLIGISQPQELIGRDAFDLHDKLCVMTGKIHDPCVIDTFMAAIDFMEGGEPVPWYNFTEKRKKIQAKKKGRS